MWFVLFDSSFPTEKKSLVEGDSDDDGQPNTYDYKDSFIDDDDDDDDGISGGYSVAMVLVE